MRTTGVELVARTGVFSRAFRGAAKDVDNLNDKLDETGKKRDLDEQAKQAETLSKRIRETQVAVQNLARSYVASGGDNGILKQLKQQQRALGDLKRIEKLLPDGKDVVGAGVTMGQRLSQGIVRSLPPQLTMTIVGAGVSAAPLLGAAISGAIIGGAGIGGVVGGLAIAAKDARVAEAANQLGDRLERRLSQAGGVMVRPALDAIAQIDKAIATIDLEQILRDSARNVQPLMAGVSRAITEIGDGLEALVANAGPVMRVVGAGIAQIGKAVGDGMESVANNGPAAADALQTVFALVTSGTQTTFRLVDALTRLYGIGQKIGADMALQLILKLTGAAMDDTTDSARRTTAGTFGMKGAIDAAAGAARGELGAMKALSDELRAQTDPAFALLQAQEKLKTAQDRAAEATRKHGRSSVEARQATRDLASAALDMQAKAGSLAAGFNGKLTPAMRNTYKTAGLTEAQINDVERELGSARTAADRYAGNYKANVTLTGASGVRRGLADLVVLQQALRKGVSMSAARSLAGDAAAARDRNLFSAGGWTGPGSKYQSAGTVHADEFVIKKESRQKIERRAPGLLDQMNATGRMPGYAAGGRVWPFPATASMTRVPSKAEAASVVTPAVPSGGRTSDWIVQAARALVGAIRVISKDRPGAITSSGNRSYHSMGRAVDFAPSITLARRWNQTYGRRTKEEITPWRQYDLRNGRPYHYSGHLHAEHSGGNAHVHIAMAGGGTIREPVFGVGRSGATYSFGEGGVHERVTPIGSGSSSGGLTRVINVNVAVSPLSHPAEVGRAVVTSIQAYEKGSGASWRDS